MEKRGDISSQTKVIKSLALLYGLGSTLFFLAFVMRFGSRAFSESPADWADIAAMMAALLGPPAALWSVAIVLSSVQLQQRQLLAQLAQHAEMMDRENRRLDPVIKCIEFTADSSWVPGTLGGQQCAVGGLPVGWISSKGQKRGGGARSGAKGVSPID